MEDDIRALLLKYGIAEVHEALKNVCQRMYCELGQIYGPSTGIENVVKVCAIGSPEPGIYLPTPSMQSILAGKEPPQLDLNSEEEEEDTVKEVVLPKRIIKKKKVEQQQEVSIVPLNELVSVVPTEEPWTSEQTRMKAAHRKAIQDKLDELTAKGVDPNTFLTKENLQTWIGEGKTYNSIARDIGLHESVVSKAAKEFGIETKTDRSKIMKWVTKGRRGGKS
jgi:hypothetical protein